MTSYKFEMSDLEGMRDDLLQRTPDPLQVVELFQVFLANNGYGLSLPTALESACRAGRSGWSTITLQRELDSLALSM